MRERISRAIVRTLHKYQPIEERRAQMMFLSLLSEQDQAHSATVTELALRLVMTMSEENRVPAQLVAFAAMYHDIGKIGGGCDHATRGAAILRFSPCFEFWRSKFTAEEYAMAIEAARCHDHAHYNTHSSIVSRIVYDANRVAYSGFERLRQLYKQELFCNAEADRCGRSGRSAAQGYQGRLR